MEVIGSNLELKYSKVAEILFQPVRVPELRTQEVKSRTKIQNGARYLAEMGARQKIIVYRLVLLEV